MVMEAFVASLTSPTATCARRGSFERTRSQKPLQALPANLCRAGRSGTSSKTSRGSGRLPRQACRAAPKDKNSPGHLGDFDLAEYVEAKVDGGERFWQPSIPIPFSHECETVAAPTPQAPTAWIPGPRVTWRGFRNRGAQQTCRSQRAHSAMHEGVSELMRATLAAERFLCACRGARHSGIEACHVLPCSQADGAVRTRHLPTPDGRPMQQSAACVHW